MGNRSIHVVDPVINLVKRCFELLQLSWPKVSVELRFDLLLGGIDLRLQLVLELIDLLSRLILLLHLHFSLCQNLNVLIHKVYMLMDLSHQIYRRETLGL